MLYVLIHSHLPNNEINSNLNLWISRLTGIYLLKNIFHRTAKLETLETSKNLPAFYKNIRDVQRIYSIHLHNIKRITKQSSKAIWGAN